MHAESPEENVVQLSTGQVILPKLGSKFHVHEIAVVKLFLLWPGNKARPIACVKECPWLAHFIYGGGGEGSFECFPFIYERVPITPYTTSVWKTEAKLLVKHSLHVGTLLWNEPFVF